jgi:hypothetical protein
VALRILVCGQKLLIRKVLLPEMAEQLPVDEPSHNQLLLTLDALPSPRTPTLEGTRSHPPQAGRNWRGDKI